MTQLVLLIITTVVSVAGLILGIVNLTINQKNRRNALREMVYKEQLLFFSDYKKRLSEIFNLIVDLEFAESDEFDELVLQFRSKFNDLKTLKDGKDFIIPSELFGITHQCIIELSHFSRELPNGKKCFTDELYDKLTDNELDLTDSILEHLKLEHLSRENINLIRNSRKSRIE